MQLRKLFYLMLIIPILFLNQACSDDKGTDPVEINEAEVLAKHLESFPATFPATISAVDLNSKILTAPNTIAVLDIRSATDFGNGHIQGAVNVAAADLLTYYESNSLHSKEVVALVCYSGQTAAWATALLRMAGYSNVKDLTFGMCSWNDTTANSWKNNIGNTYAAQFTTTAAPRNAAGELPELNTGKETGADIARARIEAVLAEGFSVATITNANLFANLSANYIVNYWSSEHYSWGHVPGAVQYTPGASSELTYSAALNTLPTDKPVVVYCYTGTGSGHIAAYLRVLGYDGKSLLFGVNGMSYDTMPGTKFDPATHIMGYELY
jgi:rhodanese-related sulfurtransferase